MIEVRNLHKSFGAVSVLHGISFTAQDGAVTGFVGPNGAGKSTTMKVICGLDKADSGEALVDGELFSASLRPGKDLGIHFSGERFPDAMTARDLLSYAALLVDAPAAEGDRLLELVGLSDVGNREVSKFSMGMRQRFGIAMALLGDPKNLMLDEPVNGLDPNGVAWVRGLLRHLADSGKAVLLSSHLMSELELIADNVVILNRGEVIASGSASELHQANRRIVEVVTRQPDGVAEFLTSQGFTVVVAGDNCLHIANANSEEIGRLIFNSGLGLTSLAELENTLEETFLELTGDSQEGGKTARFATFEKEK